MKFSELYPDAQPGIPVSDEFVFAIHEHQERPCDVCGEVTQWFVKPGDTVTEDQPLCEVMTDKATVEIPSPIAGKVLELIAKVGETVPVESVLIVLEQSGSGKVSPPAKEKKKAAASAAAPAFPPPVTTQTATMAPAPLKVLASPATRKLAREMDIDIRTVSGSGPNGRVTKADVERTPAGRQ